MGNGELFAYLPAERKTILANCFRIKFNWGLRGTATGKLLSMSVSVSPVMPCVIPALRLLRGLSHILPILR